MSKLEIDLEHHALLGDQQAQEECAKLGIALPCPCCGSGVTVNEIPPHKHAFATFMPDYEGGCFIECPSCNYANCGKTKHKALMNHNRRPAPPIGRCKDCKHQGTGDSDICHSGMDEEFCSGFESK